MQTERSLATGEGVVGTGSQPSFQMSEELAEEMEALEAIFDQEMTVDKTSSAALRLSFTLPGVAEALSARSSDGVEVGPSNPSRGQGPPLTLFRLISSYTTNVRLYEKHADISLNRTC